MDSKVCSQCAYFRQHYALDERKLFRVYCGHCVVSNPKRKRPDAAACGQFAPGVKDTDAFVTKEYLSKVFLQYMEKLELLPEIANDSVDIRPK